MRLVWSFSNFGHVFGVYKKNMKEVTEIHLMPALNPIKGNRPIADLR